MADTEYYIDPSIGSNTGSGTFSDPWGDLQHGMNNIVFPSSGSNHTRVNIKSSATSFLANDLQFTWGGSDVTRTFTMEGYDSVAGDGGRAAIHTTDGFIDKQNVDNMKLVNLDVVASGGHGDFIIHLDRQCAIHNCSLTTDAISSAIFLDLYSTITNCHIKCTSTSQDLEAISGSNGMQGTICNSIIEYAGDGKVSRQYSHLNNLIIISHQDGSGPELTLKAFAQGNIVYKNNSSGASAQSSAFSTADALPMQTFIGNYIEGFTGNSSAFQRSNGDAQSATMIGNYFFNCTSPISIGTFGTAWPHGSSTLMEVPTLLGSSALTDPTNADYSLNNTTIRDLFISPADNGSEIYYMRHRFDDSFGGGGGSSSSSAHARFTRLD